MNVPPIFAWLTFTAGCVFVTVDVVRLNITGLALAGAVMLVLWLWGIGGFRRDFWVEDIGPDHPDALGSLDIRERAQWSGVSENNQEDVR